EVSSFGGKLKQYEIAVNPDRLHSFNLSIQDVFDAMAKNNQNTGGAYIEKGPTVLFIRTEGLIGKTTDIENIVVKSTSSGVPVLIRDIAEVNIGSATRYGAMCYNDEGEVSGAVVMMLKGANSSAVIKNVKERIVQIQKSLPEGVVIEPFLDRTKMVNNAIGTVEKNLLEGALIVIFILVIFLGNLRAGLLVASVIPLAMLFAVIMMNFFGVSGNLMSLGALDFGLIVDGAVIIVEAVMHQLTHSKTFSHVQRINQKEMDRQVAGSAGKMMNSAVFGQIIILIVYLPIFTLQGIEGKMFKPMAQTVAFALVGAFLLSLTYIPMMSALVLSKKIKHEANWSDRIMFVIEQKYQHVLAKILNYPRLLLSSVVVLFITAIVVLSQLGGEFIPALEEGDFAVDTRVLTGSNLNTTVEHCIQAAGILKQRFPEVEKVVTKIGSGEVPTDPMPMEAADMMVILKDKSEWTSAKTFPELANKMSKALEDVPGITTGFQFPVQMRFNELMTGARQDVVCKIFGENLDTLSAYAAKLSAIINTVNGAQDLYLETLTGVPQVVIEYDRALMAQYHLNVDDVNIIVNTAFAGQSTGMLYEGEKRFDLVVRLDRKLRNNIEDIQNLLIPTPNGNQIPLQQLAKVEIKNGPSQIYREDSKRRIVVGFNVRNRDVQSIVTELQSKVDAQIKFPAGYYTTFGGAFENLNEAKKRLSIAVPISLAMIFLLLFFAFNSIRHSILIYTAIPLSAIGGIYFLALRGMPFSISAGIGFIALFGVAVLNGIVLIAEFNRLVQSGVKDLHRVVLMGTKVRLRPVLMTAFVASLGFLPMALSNGAGAEVQRPLATVVIGGLLIATFLTLFVLPMLYVLFEKRNLNKQAKRAPTSLLVVLCCGFYGITSAQTIPISHAAAIEMAWKNNQVIKNQELQAEYRQKMIQTAKNLPSTSISGDVGQVNSAYTDTRLAISQSFQLPIVYSKQKKVLEDEWNSSMLAISVSKAELRKKVSTLFYSLLVLKEKEKMLRKTDSLYTQFVEKTKTRLAKGESNMLELNAAEIQYGNLQLQLKSLLSEIETQQLQFRWVLNSSDNVFPEGESTAELVTVPKSSPLLQWYAQQVQLANSNLELEKTRLLPEFNIGVFNQSIRGIGADDKFYKGTTRFNGAQIGLGIPIFRASQKAKIESFKTLATISTQEFNMKKGELDKDLQSAMISYKSNLEIVDQYEKVLLPKGSTITKIAATQYSAGEINYLEWSMLNNQNLQIQNSYLDAVQQLNDSIIQINYLNSK
ncbi:MAG: CusA/CzcA family heavy metal efflux RND transporter, partial [Saprospiraceae bacterium]